MARRLVWTLAAAALLGAGGAGASIGAQAAAPAQTAALVKTTPARTLVTAQGMTLYVYAPDKKNRSACYGECAEYWPPLIVAPDATIPAVMPGVAGTFGATTRTDGKRQLTYDGAPLYTFIKDKKPGQMAGQGLDVAGGYWWAVVVPSVASSSGSAPAAQPTPAATATPSSGGSGGYYGGNNGDDHHRNRGNQTAPTPGSYYGGGHGGHGRDG